MTFSLTVFEAIFGRCMMSMIFFWKSLFFSDSPMKDKFGDINHFTFIRNEKSIIIEVFRVFMSTKHEFKYQFLVLPFELFAIAIFKTVIGIKSVARAKKYAKKVLKMLFSVNAKETLISPQCLASYPINLFKHSHLFISY